MKSRIWLSSPHMGEKELEYVKEAFEANWIAPLGPNVDGFEQELADYLDIEHVAALSSGTAALHLALILLGVSRDDEVICSSFTFSASANPVVYQGATPIFVDCESDTWNMDPDLMEEAIKDRISKGKKPKAIILVHLYGMPAKINEIFSIAKKYDIPVIEDAAEALGSKYYDKAVGTFGKFSIFSFNGNKIITTSGGGALVSSDKQLVDKSRFLATQARDKAAHYQHTHIGYNYRMSNICAGIGRGQLKVLDMRVRQRREIYSFYVNLLESIEGIAFVNEPEGSFSNRWLTTVLIDPNKADVTPETLRLVLEKDNIESRPLWKPMHLQPVFKDSPSYTNGTSEYLFKNGLCLPSGSNLNNDDKERISIILRNCLK